MGRGPVGAPAIIRYVNNSLASVDDVSGADGSMKLIKTVTASSDATISFVDGTSDVVLDNTYPVYLFKFIGIHPQTDVKGFRFQGSIDTGSNYNVAITSTFFNAYHDEADTDTSLNYVTAHDLAQGTGFQRLTHASANDADNTAATGELWLFNPSSTTFVKHWMARISDNHSDNYAVDRFPAGYFNTTSAIDAIQFKMESGNMDAGQIKLYGIKDS